MMGVIFLLSLLTILPQIMAAGKQELQAVIQGNGNFTKKLYNILSEEPGNVFFSPISAHAVLAMAYQGAGGSTKDAFTKTLAIDSPLQAAEGYSDVIHHLNNVSDVELLMANKVYIKNGYGLKAAFKEVAQKKFLSEVESVEFAKTAEAAKKINLWVEKKTQNKIKDLIQPDSLSDLTRLVLVNAIYFKGNWASKFDKSQTKTEKFYLNDNDSIDVQMMNKKGKYFYKEDEKLDAKVLELPYANPDVSLIVILPNKRNGIAELEAKLAETDLTKITENMFKPEVVVKLPKFKIETTINLNKPLEKAGLGVIFKENEADFSEMLDSPEELFVSQVIQKAFIEVNEEGTEAAAATEFEMIPRRLIVSKEMHFTVDHPFIILMQTQQKLNPRRRTRMSNTIFMGKLCNF
ncbi:unnamed protein product [Ceutorhynchus assimilis]|uniref:Serpin domain-containing protein n=1 Tax=Ceutorhynchus assimilis TaxID=467358 RepID=A0A9P0GMS8_9CUCU|nr:unnamed protein product [Ceutorhynchus assimilis]